MVTDTFGCLWFYEKVRDNEPIAATDWQVKFTLTLIVLWLTLSVAVGHSRETIVVGGLDGLDQFDNTDQFPVLLALSGGGARGLAAIGILRAFEEKGITVAAITGTSIGGTIGVLYT